MNYYHSTLQPRIFSALAQRINELDLSKTHNRMLLLLETIGLYGPITMSELETCLPMSRAAIWRTTTALRDFGWARMRLSDSAIELTFKLDDFAANATFASRELYDFAPLFDLVTATGGFNLQFACIEKLGYCRLAENTETTEHSTDEVSMLHDDLAYAALAALPENEAVRHIRHHMQRAVAHDTEHFKFETYQSAINKIRTNRILWGHNDSYICLPLLSKPATGCAMRVSIKSNDQCSKHRLKRLAKKMQGMVL